MANNPKYTLVIKSRAREKATTTAGALFENEFGGFNLILNPGVVLKWDDDVYFNINPYLTKRQWNQLRASRYAQEEEQHMDPPGGDELEDQEEPELVDLSELPPDDDEPK